ncbi:MAG: hypothetical protein AAB263_12915 [Planctomycetota bacterium]
MSDPQTSQSHLASTRTTQSEHQARDLAFGDGFTAGHKAGTMAGYERGYNDGAKLGYLEGYEFGKDVGFEEGVEATEPPPLRNGEHN